MCVNWYFCSSSYACSLHCTTLSNSLENLVTLLSSCRANIEFYLTNLGCCHRWQLGTCRNHWELQIGGYWWVETSLNAFNHTHLIHTHTHTQTHTNTNINLHSSNEETVAYFRAAHGKLICRCILCGCVWKSDFALRCKVCYKYLLRMEYTRIDIKFSLIPTLFDTSNSTHPSYNPPSRTVLDIDIYFITFYPIPSHYLCHNLLCFKLSIYVFLEFLLYTIFIAESNIVIHLK